MTLPAPNLDDRRFQDLVDDAKRLVQRRCPEWTDHNVSDPGITLIETFAYVVDQVLYRLNRVPERSYVTFLELMGVELFAPSAAARRRHVVAHRRTGGRSCASRPARRSRPGDGGPARRSCSRRSRTSTFCAARRVYVMTGGRDTQPYDQTGELANERPVAALLAARRRSTTRS